MKKSLKSYRTKVQLAETLKELLKTEPIEKVRIHQLTEPCHIHRQSFYYHFEDIYALLEWSVRQDMDEWVNSPDFSQHWQQRIVHLLRCIAGNRNYYLAIMSSPCCSRIQQTFREKLATALRDSAAAAGFPPEALEDAHLAAQAEIVYFVLDQWSQGKLKLSLEEVAAFIAAQTDRAWAVGRDSQTGRPLSVPPESQHAALCSRP